MLWHMVEHLRGIVHGDTSSERAAICTLYALLGYSYEQIEHMMELARHN
jgi:hypothetical protein